MSKVMCMMSGGIDSTTMSVELMKNGHEVVGVFADYGQENAPITWDMALWQAEKYGWEIHKITIPMEWSESSMLKGRFESEGYTEQNVYRQNKSEMFWVPARNAIMFLMAGGLASKMGIDRVFNSILLDTAKWKIYDELLIKSDFDMADLTPDFMGHLNQIAPYCYKTRVHFDAPYLFMRFDTSDVVKIARRLDVDLEHTYSCRYFVNGGACGVCEMCIIRGRRLRGIKGDFPT